MYIIKDNPLCETDDYEEIQEAFEGYLYGAHRGLDEKEYDWGDKYDWFDYINYTLKESSILNGTHINIK